MAYSPTDDEIREGVRNLKRCMRMPEIVRAAGGPSERTLYRQLEPDAPEMDPETRTCLTDLLESIGMGEPSPDVRKAAQRGRQLAIERVAAAGADEVRRRRK